MFSKNKILLFVILFLGLFLRLYGNNWDQGFHLHPDERFLTMVGVDVKIPPTISEYLNQKSSTFNPVNKGHGFYVYGTLPVLLNKLFAQYFDTDTYGLFNLQGRALSGIADFMVILIVYKIGELIEKKLKLSPTVKYLAAFFYAIAVLPIQLSHFFTVDTFLNLFCWLSFYFAVKLIVFSYTAQRTTFKRYTLHVTWYASLSGLFFGLALACKVSSIYFAPLVGIVIFIGIISLLLSFPRTRESRGKYTLFELKTRGWIPASAGMTCGLIGMTCFVIFCYLALRLGSPYYFETNTIFNPTLSTVFINNINTLKSFDNPQMLFPPAIQWLSKSYDFPIKNLIFFGVGPFYFLCALLGGFILFKKKNIYVTVSILWMLLFLVYQSVQFSKTMRYLVFLYPFLAILAAVGISYIFNIVKKFQNVTRYTLHAVCYVLILFWPLAFMSIYTKDHARVEASKWIYENIPQNSKITYEYWDDVLPLAVENPTTRNYSIIEVHIFDPDTNEKWKIINDQLAQADYYSMSSNRGWGSLTTVPDRYPTSTKFYKNMFEGMGGFTLMKEFSSYPSLRYLGIPIDFSDQWADESFTVYDHPQVIIYKNEQAK